MARTASRKKIGLFANAFNEMNMHSGGAGQRAGNRDAGKSSAGAKSTQTSRRAPDEELERIGNVPGPNQRKCRFCDEVDFLLPDQQQINEHLEAFLRFT